MHLVLPAGSAPRHGDVPNMPNMPNMPNKLAKLGLLCLKMR